MTIANTTLEQLRDDVVAAIQALVLTDSGHTPDSAISFQYTGEKDTTTLGFRKFVLRFDIDKMKEGRWHGGGQVSWEIPMTVRVGYLGKARFAAENAMASDKRQLWQMIHDAEGGDIPGMLPGETKGIVSETTGKPGGDPPFYVDYTIDVHFMTQDG